MGVFSYSPWDFVFTCLGLLFLLLDIGLDILALVTFYQEKSHVCLGLLLLFLLGSSVLVQAFSWLWYSYENFSRHTRVEQCPSPGQLLLLHVLQLGIYFRHAGVVETSVNSFLAEQQGSHGDNAVFLSHDLSMLRLIETFSESAPQLVLMLTIILQRGELDPVTALKALGSASAIAFSVTMYHRSLRSFLPDKKQQNMASSVVYFLWNVILIASRLTALALFASLLPCFIFAHFICSWLLFFFFVWRSKTDFMDSPGGEWLYRATVGLIWYFDWFNVVEGRTRYRTLLYHGYMLADISLLCALWCWRTTATEQPYFELSPLQAAITAVSVVACYILGLFIKMIYYRRFHPNLHKEELKGSTVDQDEVDSNDVASPAILNGTGVNELPQFRSIPQASGGNHCNKRMRILAENFYT
eukprot:XP_003969277.1 PREDICTED: XK-related protein 8-like [Takifugu rubripes]